MIPTNRQPPGLLSFFGVKNQGRLPGYPDGAVYGLVIEANDWLYADPLASEIVAGSQNVAAVNAANAGTGPVPAGQIWLVLNASGQTAAALGAGVTWSGSLVHLQAGTPSMVEVIGPPSPVVTTGAVPTLSTYRTSPFFMRQGDSIAIQTNTLVGAAFAVTTNVRIVRMTL